MFEPGLKQESGEIMTWIYIFSDRHRMKREIHRDSLFLTFLSFCEFFVENKYYITPTSLSSSGKLVTRCYGYNCFFSIINIQVCRYKKRTRCEKTLLRCCLHIDKINEEPWVRRMGYIGKQLRTNCFIFGMRSWWYENIILGQFFLNLQ